VPVTSIIRTGDTAKIDLKVLSASNKGTLNEDASAMTGSWSQAGVGLPLNLQRRSQSAPPPTPPPGSQQGPSVISPDVLPDGISYSGAASENGWTARE
jgi:hypothetical protein